MKDLLKTCAGKYVAPQPIENSLKNSPYILNAMVVGDRRKFVVALVVPNCKLISAKAAESGVTISCSEEVAEHPFTRTLIHPEIQRLTANLAQYETIKRFALPPAPFTLPNGALTFTTNLHPPHAPHPHHPLL